MDVGSFVFEASGVRWAIDPDIEEYLDLRARTGLTHAQLFSYAQESQRWNALRLGPDGHSILRFDNARQLIAGHAKIPVLEYRHDWLHAFIDLTAIYADQVAMAERHFELAPDGTLHLTDCWKTGAEPRQFRFQWITLADVQPTPTGARLTQAGETLNLTIQQPQGKTLTIQDLSQGLTPSFDAPYPSLKRILIDSYTPAHTADQLALHLASAPRL
jgi:hypothetical protein